MGTLGVVSVECPTVLSARAGVPGVSLVGLKSHLLRSDFGLRELEASDDVDDVAVVVEATTVVADAVEVGVVLEVGLKVLRVGAEVE